MVEIDQDSASYWAGLGLEWIVAMLPPAISAVATRIQAEVHSCPKCGVTVVTMRDSGNADASAECRCRHNHAFVPTGATLAPKTKDPAPHTVPSQGSPEPDALSSKPKKKPRK